MPLPLLLGSHPPAEWSGDSKLDPAVQEGMGALRTPPWTRRKVKAAASAPAPVPAARRPITPSLFRLEMGEAVRLRVPQDRGDLRVVVRGPGGRVVLEVDAYNGTSGPEDLTILAPEDGVYRIEAMVSASAWAGPYPARIVSRRPAESEDRWRWRAARLTWQAQAVEPSPARLTLLSKALVLYTRLGDRGGIADLSFLLGSAFEAGGHRAEAELAYQRAAALYRVLPCGAQYLAALHRLANFRFATNDLRGAHRAAREGWEAAGARAETSWRASFLVLLGMVEIERGRPDAALPLLEEAVAIRKTVGDGPARTEALNALGRAHFKLGNVGRALELHRRALELLDPRRDAELIARTLHHLGDAFTALGDSGRAFFRLHFASRIWTQLGAAEDGAITLHSLARNALLEGDLATALRLQRRAVRLLLERRDAANGAQALANLGWIHAALQAPRRALRMATRAERQAGPHPRPALTAFLHLLRARAYGELGELELAVGESVRALALVEARRSAIERAELRLGFAPTVQSYYEVAIESLMALHARYPGGGWDRAGLEISERARARALLDALEGRAAQPIASVETIQTRLLDGETAVLELFVGPRKSYLWLVTRDALRSYEIPGRERLRRLLEPVLQGAPRSDRMADLRELHRQARALSHALFGPLRELPAQRRLVLVMPPELQALSFSSLPNPFVTGGTGSEEEWPDPLLLAKTIVVEPSMAVLAALRQSPLPRDALPRGIGAFASPLYSLPGAPGPREGTPLACRDGALLLPLPSLSPLRLGAEETRSLARSGGSGRVRAFLGAAASAGRFLGLDFRPYRYLYLSGHGRADPADAERSALVLSAFDEQGRRVEPCLFARDIAALDLSAELVMLSACASGLGKLIPGEGLIGLGQAFLTAGAKRVGVTLWDVQEGPTAALMESFHRLYLERGLDPADALRAAQIDLWRRPGFASPAFWGGFQILGDWSGPAPEPAGVRAARPERTAPR